MRRNLTRRAVRLTAVALPLGLAASLAGVAGVPTGAGAAARRGTDTVNVVGYSIVANAYAALEAAFQKTTAGRNVVFNNSFGASTTQAENVVEGQAADVVNFSTAPDMQQLVDNGIVSPRWAVTGAGAAERGFVADSVVVLVTRPGNPLGLKGWSDLTKAGVQIVTPDPISSGSARWNLLEIYESQIIQKKSASAAAAFTNSVIAHVLAEPSSGSKALTAFLAGTGNVLLAYEADAEAARAAGKPVQLVYPKQNISIQTPAALTGTGTKNAGARAFFAYLFSHAGQNIWAHQGYRPTVAAIAKSDAKLFAHTYPATELTTIAALKGWPAVTNKFFGQPNGIITKIEAAHGYTS
jgi:sulfate/thiosulfate transport system substrate-binding protein